MPTTSSCRFPRILAHVDGSRQAWAIDRNTSRSVLIVGSKVPRNGLVGNRTANCTHQRYVSHKPTSGESSGLAQLAGLRILHQLDAPFRILELGARTEWGRSQRALKARLALTSVGAASIRT